MKRERYKRIITFIEAVILMVVLTALFGVVWYKEYFDTIKNPFWNRGNWAVIGMYFIILFLFVNLYGGLKVGYLRLMDVIYSQMLSLICTNVVFYVQLCIIARDYVNPSIMIGFTFCEVIVILAWIFACRFIYGKLYPPRRLLLIYGEKTPKDFINKINARSDKYKVCEWVRASEGEFTIKDKIQDYDAVVICETNSHMRNIILKYCFESSVRTYVVPKVTDIILRGSDEMHLFDTPMLLSRNQGLSGDQLIAKRLLDIVFTLVGCIVAIPIMLIIAICIKVYDRGPVFYKQQRLTLDGKVFWIYKFRSMRVDSEKDGARLCAEGDDRITPIGRIIRKLHLDELPQIINILKGDMSLVGPRPERPEIAEQYKKVIPEFDYRLKVKAGLTGYAQVYGKYNTTPRDKLKLDLAYIENYSIWQDIKLLMLTFKVLFQKENTEGVNKNQKTAVKVETNEGDAKD